MISEVIFSSCLHEYFATNLNNNVLVKMCKYCSILSVDLKEIYFMKARDYNTPCEVDKVKLLEKMVMELNLIKKKENLNYDYISKRCRIIIYLKKIVQKYKYSLETYYLSLSLIDKLLINFSLPDLKYDLVVIGCLLVSVKFLEKNPSIPDYSDFRNSSKDFYTKEEIASSEIRCLQALDYNIGELTSFDILLFFLTNGLATLSCTYTDQNDLNNFYNTCFLILAYFNDDIRSIDFTKTEVAISSLIRASEICNLHKNVKMTLTKIYGFTTEIFFNSSIVIKSIFPANEEKTKSTETELIKQKNSMNSVYSYNINVSDQENIVNNKSTMKSIPRKFLQIQSINFENQQNLLRIKAAIQIKEVSPQSYMSTNGSNSTSKRNSYDSCFVDISEQDNASVTEQNNNINNNNSYIKPNSCK